MCKKNWGIYEKKKDNWENTLPIAKILLPQRQVIRSRIQKLDRRIIAWVVIIRVTRAPAYTKGQYACAVSSDTSSFVRKFEAYGRPRGWIDVGCEDVERGHFGAGLDWAVVANGEERGAEGGER